MVLIEETEMFRTFRCSHCRALQVVNRKGWSPPTPTKCGKCRL